MATPGPTPHSTGCPRSWPGVTPFSFSQIEERGTCLSFRGGGAEADRPTDRLPLTACCQGRRLPFLLASHSRMPRGPTQWALKVPSSYKVQFTEGCHRILVGTYTGVSSFAKSATVCQYYYPIRFAPTPSQETNCP